MSMLDGINPDGTVTQQITVQKGKVQVSALVELILPNRNYWASN